MPVLFAQLATLARLVLTAALDTMPMERVVIVAQLPFLTALIAPPLPLAPHAPLDIPGLFAMAAFQDITKTQQPVLIVPLLTLIASPAQIVLTVTVAKLATLELPAIAAHLITTEMVPPALLARPLIVTV